MILNKCSEIDGFSEAERNCYFTEIWAPLMAEWFYTQNW